MRSASFATLGLCVAGVLIFSNIMLLRYFSDSVKSTLDSNKKSKAHIISRYTFPAQPVNIVDDFGILDKSDPLSRRFRRLESIHSDLEITPPTHEADKKLIFPTQGKTVFRSTSKEAAADIQNLIDEISTAANFSCRLKVKFGRDENAVFGHETWRLCFDQPYKMETPCLVYSFGIAYDFTFDDDLANYGCDVFSFDPSMEMADRKRDSGVMFFNIGIAQRDSFSYKPDVNAFNNRTRWVVKSLYSIRKSLKHVDRIIDVVKLDVEGMEWVSLQQAIDDNILRDIKYLLVEWHVCPKDFPSSSKVHDALDMYRQLYLLGFVKYFSDRWMTDPTNGCQMVLNYFLRPASFQSAITKSF